MAFLYDCGVVREYLSSGPRDALMSTPTAELKCSGDAYWKRMGMKRR